MTLDKVAMDVPARITGFSGVGEAEQLRLSSHGISAGAVITKLLRAPLRDHIECLVGPQLLTLDAALLSRILVEER